MFFMAVGAALAILCVTAATISDSTPASTALVGLVAGAIVGRIGYSYAYRFRIVLTEDQLIVVELFGATQFPIGAVASVSPGRNAIVFRTNDGQHCTAPAVETGLLMKVPGRHARADEVAAAVMAAAASKRT